MDKTLKLETADNRKERKSPLISTDSPPSSPLSKPLEPSPSDDDSITTFTESSDTSEAWTLVMDKQKLESEKRVELVKGNDHDDDDEHGDEDEDEYEDEHDDEDEYEDEEVEQAEKSNDKELHDSSNDVTTTDDLSDGISIISESESNGRASPHTYVRDHLQDLNFKFATGQYEDEILQKLKRQVENADSYPTPAVVNDQQYIRQRTVRTSSKEVQKRKGTNTLQETSRSLVEHNDIPPLLKRGLHGIFYIGVAVAILGLIGRIRFPTVENDPSTRKIEQKVKLMEFQNHLMKDEIDLLSKQIKNLYSINRLQLKEMQKQYAKTIKVWPGNGDTLIPIDISKDDLKRPYKCPDGSFTEIAGMCVENQSKEPNILKQFENLKQLLVDNREQQPEQEDNSDLKTPEELPQQNAFTNNKPIYEPAKEQIPQYDDKQEYAEDNPYQPIRSYGYKKCEDMSDANCFDKEFKRAYDRKKKLQKQQHASHASEEFDKYKNKFDKRGDNNDHNSDSKERFNKRRNDSKERYKNRKDNSNEHQHKRRDDGEWQEELMKHRAHLRRENEQKFNGDHKSKNWYIKRGDDRENIRNIYDTQHR